MGKYLKKLKIEFVEGDFKNLVKGRVRQPKQVFSVFSDLKDSTRETLVGVYLTDIFEIASYEVLSIGGSHMTLAIPSEIFRSAILTNSRYFILIHNHPSGNAEPSDADKDVMKMLKEQSSIMNCVMLDFIIVGDDAYWSLHEAQRGEKVYASVRD